MKALEENLIRLHASVCGDGGEAGVSVAGQDVHQTISATVNVATLDLSDPEAIHQHLSQLNDTVLRVSGFEEEDDKVPRCVTGFLFSWQGILEVFSGLRLTMCYHLRIGT